MTEEELLIEMEAFICDEGRWTLFIQRMKEKGYTEKEIDALFDKVR